MNLLFENWRSFLKEVDIALPPEADGVYSNFAITPNTIGDSEPTFVLFDP
ncbi:MAG: hypothetical protein ACXADH_15060 [Candidatus Kariarchaeaceae archaeon]|jgi:hypothetical protein